MQQAVRQSGSQEVRKTVYQSTVPFTERCGDVRALVFVTWSGCTVLHFQFFIQSEAQPEETSGVQYLILVRSIHLSSPASLTRSYLYRITV